VLLIFNLHCGYLLPASSIILVYYGRASLRRFSLVFNELWLLVLEMTASDISS
jgi:hypothetical protein